MISATITRPDWAPFVGDGEDCTGVYLTDGRRLYRVVRTFTPLQGRPAHLEDCLTLEVHAYTPEELWEMQLQPVVLAAGPDPT